MKKQLSISVDILFIVLLIVATIVLNLVMIRDGLNGMTDMKWHLTWLQHFYQQITEGIWYPRWLAGTNYGYGSPTFVFYPPLVYYLGSLFLFLGFSPENTLTLLFSLALFLAGFNFYLLGYQTWGKLPSFIGALFYMSTPYLAFDIYYRSGLASIFVQAWIPLLLFATFKTIEHYKFALLLGLTWCLIALTHTPSLLLCSLVYFLYLILLLPQKGGKKIASLIFTTLCGWGMASIYLIPAILEKAEVNINSLKDVHGGFRDALIGKSLPLFPLEITDLLKIPNIFLYQLLAIILLASICLIGITKNKFIKKEITLWLIIAVILAFLMTGLSQFIWESSSILQMVQFPWRFLQFFSVIGAIIAAISFKVALNHKLPLQIIIFALIILFLFGNNYYWYKLSRQFITLNYSGKGKTEHLNHIKTILNSPYDDNLRDVPEYRPLLDNPTANPPKPLKQQPKISVLEGKASINLQQWHSYQRKFRITSETLSTIKIRTYFYPAWHLYVDNQLFPLKKHLDGTITFQLTPGTYNIQLLYQKTTSFRWGITLSILSLNCLLLCCLLKAKIFKFSE